MGSPGGGNPLTVKWVAKIQHPDLFADLDIRQETADFFKEVYDFTLTEEMLDMILNDVQDFE